MGSDNLANPLPCLYKHLTAAKGLSHFISLFLANFGLLAFLKSKKNFKLINNTI